MKSLFENHSNNLNNVGKKFEQDSTNLITDFLYDYIKKGYNIHELKFVFDSALLNACTIVEDEIIHHFNNIKDPKYRVQLESIYSLINGEIKRGECIGSDIKGRVLLKQESGFEPLYPFSVVINESGNYWAIENKYKDN